MLKKTPFRLVFTAPSNGVLQIRTWSVCRQIPIHRRVTSPVPLWHWAYSLSSGKSSDEVYSIVINQNPAVVLGLSPNGLGVIRSLASAGVPVIGIDRPPSGIGDAHRWMSSRTRLCRKVFYDEAAGDGLLECLLSLGKTLHRRGILFPTGDEELLCISRNREALSEFYRFRVPEIDLVELLADKARFYPVAQQNGVQIPQTYVEPSIESIASISESIRYPCLIKPNLPDSRWASLFGGQKAITAHDAEQLVQTFRQVNSLYSNVLVQEVIPGPDRNLYFSHIYMPESLVPLAIWTGRKIRQRPIHFGTSTLTETVWEEDVAQCSVRLLQALRCVGYSSIEFKMDQRDHEFKIMEVTAGRTWYPHFLGFGAGINIPYIWYRDLTGEKPEVAGRAREGVRWIDEYRDIFAILDYWREGELRFVEWLKSFRGVRAFAHSSIADPLPILFVIFRLAAVLPRQIIGMLRRRGQSRSE